MSSQESSHLTTARHKYSKKLKNKKMTLKPTMNIIEVLKEEKKKSHKDIEKTTNKNMEEILNPLKKCQETQVGKKKHTYLK